MNGEHVGSVEDEARRLGEALREARREATSARAEAPPTDPPPVTPSTGPAHAAGGDACRCPWCRGHRWTHAHGPGVLRDLASATDLLTHGLRAAAGAWERRADASPGGPGDAAQDDRPTHHTRGDHDDHCDDDRSDDQRENP
ncbi:putative histidine kinase [Mobilicoccus pelagius NBRC 104925]|uniref:Putative histidine kinase n=1 Tax=Mobilicoccus pelagius NBRC 104925 TaxID=1089455 RepID=H5UUS9_9MICO|nr:putative histidine kinase [Mobilicoccus pelagius NBRC 104925]